MALGKPVGRGLQRCAGRDGHHDAQIVGDAVRVEADLNLLGLLPLKADASVATQSDYGSSNLDYTADYYLVEGTYTVDAFTGGIGIEVLGGDDQRGFQTPLATLHKFQGFADKFLTTPNTGVEDIYAKASFKVGDVGPLSGLNLSAVYHDFTADVGGADYGSELDLAASAKWDSVRITLKFADYSADDFATDTSKFWIQFDFAL